MAGLKALFNFKQIQSVFEQFEKDADAKILKVFQFAGEKFVNDARLSGNYKDRTGNLRSSIGYIILKDGKTVDSNFTGNAIGQQKAKDHAQEVSLQYPKGWVLIGVAGMKYAAAVEAKGYDVITGSAPEVELLKSIFNEI